MTLRTGIVCCLVLLLAACATAKIAPGPQGEAMQVVASEFLQIRFPAPAAWVVNKGATDRSLSIEAADPAGAAKLTVTVNPVETSAAKVVEEARKWAQDKNPGGPLQDLEGTVSGRKAYGFQTTKDSWRFTVFSVDHDRGIYVITLSSRSPAAQSTLDYIFARLELGAD